MISIRDLKTLQETGETGSQEALILLPQKIEMLFTRITESSIKEITVPEIPQTIHYKYSPKFSSQNLLGRATPIYQYSGASGASYSFSVTLHEDAHTKGNQTLEDLIDSIKSLSAPDNDRYGNLGTYPRVLFTLGELNALVKVEVNVEWKKPVRNGKYIMADVSFTIDVVEEMQPVRVLEYEDNLSPLVEGDYFYDETMMSYVLTSDQAENFMLQGIYGTSINNFITYPDSIIGMSTREVAWDASVENLRSVFGVYGDLITFTEKGRIKTLVDLLDERILLPQTITDVKQVIKNLKELKKQHEKTIKKYYEDEDIYAQMTRKEVQQVIDYIDTVINNLINMAEGAVGYGAAK